MHFTAKSLKRRYASSGTGLHHPLLTGWAGLASAVVLMPILAIAWLAISGGTADWPHLIENVIPRATGRTLLLVLFAGTATAVSGRVQRRQAEKFAGRDADIYAQRQMAYQQDMQQQYAQQAPPPPPPPAPAADTGSNIEQLKQLGELHAQGILTDEEFAAEKAKLLGN